MIDPHLFLGPWHESPVVLIDFETTGLDPETDKVVEVGAVRFEQGAEIVRCGTLVDPQRPIPAEATEVHGISDADVSGAPPLGDAIAMVDKVVDFASALPAAYNAAFDQQFWDSRDDLGLLGTNWPWLDPLIIIRHAHKFWSGKGRHKLAAVAVEYKVEAGEAHRAVDDAATAGRILYSERMRKILGNLSIGEVLRRQLTYQAEQDAEFEAYLAKQKAKEAACPPANS